MLPSIVNAIARRPRVAHLAVQALSRLAEARALAQEVRQRIPASAHRTFVLSGRVRGRVDATAVFTGRMDRVRELNRLLFSSSARIDEGQPPAGVDLVVTEAWPWQRSTESALVVQPWLEAKATPGPDPEAWLKERVGDTVKRSLKRAKTTLTLQIRGSDEAARFHRDLVVPSLTALYGSEATILPEERLLASDTSVWRLEILLAERDSVVIAGAAVLLSDLRAEVRVLEYGMSPAALEDKKLRADAMAMLNAHAFATASARGAQVNLGLTRPYLDDGVFNYKRQWGCGLYPVTGFSYFNIELKGRKAELLAAAPLFHLAPDGVRGLAAWSPREGAPPRDLSDRLNAWTYDGLSGVHVLVPDDPALRTLLTTLKAPCPVTLETSAAGV